MSSIRDNISTAGKDSAVPNAETATLFQHDAVELDQDKIGYAVSDDKIGYADGKIGDADDKIAHADENFAGAGKAVGAPATKRVHYDDLESGYTKIGGAENEEPKDADASSTYSIQPYVRKICKYGIIPALILILVFGVLTLVKLWSIESFSYDNVVAVKSLAKNNDSAIANLNTEYHTRMTSYNAFMENNTAALKDEILNLTSAITAGVVPADEISASLAAATSVADKMEVLKNMLLAVDPETFFELEPKVLATLLQVITDRFEAMDDEMTTYSAFLKEMDSNINKATKLNSNSKRSFKGANDTATSNNGDLPTIYEFSNSVFQAAIQKYAPLLFNPANIPHPITDVLSGTLVLTAGINLSPFRQNTILICPTTYYFTYVPSIGLAGNATYHDGICTSHSFQQAKKMGMAVSGKEWTWFDEEWNVTGVNNEDLGLGKFTYGERDVGGVEWVVNNGPYGVKWAVDNDPHAVHWVLDHALPTVEA